MSLTYLITALFPSLESLVPKFRINSVAAFASISALIASLFIAAWSLKAQDQSQSLNEYLFRSWPGTQTDYSSGNTNSHTDAPKEVKKHIDDIEKVFSVDPSDNLDSANFIVSSIAYGIEHHPETLKRFMNVLHRVAHHPKARRDDPARQVRIGIWPLLEHQVIWGAERGLLHNSESREKILKSSPAIHNLIFSAGKNSNSNWLAQSPNWCKDKKRFIDTIKQLKRFGKFLEYCRDNDKFISLEIFEIEPWHGRAFFSRRGRNETSSLLIITTPINSQVLTNTFFTTMGFHSESLKAYQQLSYIFDVCAKSRYEYSEPTTSKANVDKISVENADHRVRMTSQFMENPYEMIGKYFLLDPIFENSKKTTFNNFSDDQLDDLFDRIGKFRSQQEKFPDSGDLFGW